MNWGLPLMLLEVFVKEKDKLSDDFIEYETRYYDMKNERDMRCDFPTGNKVIILLFRDDTEHVFTVVRKYSQSTLKHYLSKRGYNFMAQFIHKNVNDGY
jgi:hypothetical protein